MERDGWMGGTRWNVMDGWMERDGWIEMDGWMDGTR